MGQPRPWLAAILALVYPGLGHVYLRRWSRALLWFVLAVGTAVLAIPDEAIPEASLSDPGSILAAIQTAAAEASTFGVVTFVVVVTFSIVDAYAIGRHVVHTAQTEPTARTQSCPECGRDLDEDIDFCHWCTTRLDSDDA